MEIQVMKAIMEDNINRAENLRKQFREKKVLVLNLISSPGSGKTTLLEKTIENLKKEYSIGVIEGDITTSRDAERLQQFSIPQVVINTDGACHLNSISIEKALDEFDLESLDLLFIENVGNLVCPSEFDIGESAKIAMVSTTEGDDKPAKYPLLFQEAEAVLLNKTDLIPYINFKKELFYRDLNGINPGIKIIETSCTTEEGLEEWYGWIRKKTNDLEDR
ncbi:MAG: hydrogenase accessory protein HypB [Spirochaetes bacterium]|nr:MAG: hydrogenase accessory protein HypB [Spirochaetota bacterium]